MPLALAAYVVAPAQAIATALVRVLHAVPGAGVATLELQTNSKTLDIGPLGFGQKSGLTEVPSGPFKWTLMSGGKTVMSGTGKLGTGTYTGVLMYKGSGIKDMGVMFHVYRDRMGEAGTALLRVIHSASELGSPSLQLDGQTVVKKLAFMQATPYLAVKPGVHSLAAMAPGHSGAILSVNGVRLAGGLSYTDIVIGTRGQPVRVVSIVDRGAPLTRSASIHPDATASYGHGPRWVTVQPGDSLWKIAAVRCGPEASNEDVYQELVRIWDANATRIGTGDPNLIFPGQRLHMPTGT